MADAIFEQLRDHFTGSVALLGDALHNLADVSTSPVVFTLELELARGEPSCKAYSFAA